MLPSVSIVTINYNDAIGLEKTIQSVLSQEYPYLEYIVIDGDSKDNSYSIIQKYNNQISYWVSEPDKGIYDAMNKGIQVASGKWLNFMNAGDTFKSSTTLKDFFLHPIPENAQLVYGDHEVVMEGFVKKRNAKSSDELWKGMICCHQSLFVRTSLHKMYPFDLQYKMAADFHFIYNRWKDNCFFLYREQTVARYDGSGITDSKAYQTRIQTRDIVLTRENSERVKKHFNKLLLKTQLVDFFRKIMPNSIFILLMKLKNRISGELV